MKFDFLCNYIVNLFSHTYMLEKDEKGRLMDYVIDGDSRLNVQIGNWMRRSILG